MSRFVVMILFAMLAGCAPLPNLCGRYTSIKEFTKNETTFDSVAYIGSGKVKIYLSKKLSDKEKKLRISGCERQLLAFETDWGSVTKWVTTYIFDSRTIQCGIIGPRKGCHFGKKGPIHLAYSDFYVGGYLYHELVHHNIPGNDHRHQHPLWRALWEPRQIAIRFEIMYDHIRYIYFN